MIQGMTDHLRFLMREFLDISQSSADDLAQATHKHPNQLRKVLTGQEGKLPTSWETMLKATGMKLIMVPEDAEINELELVRQKALAVRGKENRLREVDHHGETSQ